MLSELDHRGHDGSGASFSACGLYRYSLWRKWDFNGHVVSFIGLNPSTADETEDDPTIRRCIGFAKRWGYGGIYMLNIFGYRSTDPKKLKQVDDPVGRHNNENLSLYGSLSEKTVAAWGVHGTLGNRNKEVVELLSPLLCLGTTKAGHPKHPLYLRGDTELVEFK